VQISFGGCEVDIHAYCLISVRAQESEMIDCSKRVPTTISRNRFPPHRVVARVRAVLRRTFDDAVSLIAGHLRVEFDRREVFVAGDRSD